MTDRVGFYNASYGNLRQNVFAEVRAAAFGRDIGQNSWLTAEEAERFGQLLGLGQGSRLLEVGAGSGGPALFLAETFGARVDGIDANAPGVEQANAMARERGLADRADFRVADASRPLPFADDSFDAIECIDAINHLPDRAAVLAEWRRVLRPGGLMLYTDPVVVTGPITAAEIAARSSIGLFLFMPDGANQKLIGEAGLDLVLHEDATGNEATTSARWLKARERLRDDLVAIEGAETYAGTQAFLGTVNALSTSRRLSRQLFVARKR